MNVHLTFDVEIWCDGWRDLDRKFPASFERYIYGRSPRGDYALPKTLEILNRHSLRGVFFVEPLFAARFGLRYLRQVVSLIRDAGQEVQLHLHAEWTDEIDPPLLTAARSKRQHLIHYGVDEQEVLIREARALLESAGDARVTAFRAGSFAANRDTFVALRRCGIFIDSSLNACYEVSGPDLPDAGRFGAPFCEDGLVFYPVTTFRDGFGRARPAHVTACSFEELADVLLQGSASGVSDFVIVSHGFELLRPASSLPDPVVVARFEKLCRFLDEHRATMPSAGFSSSAGFAGASGGAPLAASRAATLRRHAEQAVRALLR